MGQHHHIAFQDCSVAFLHTGKQRTGDRCACAASSPYGKGASRLQGLWQHGPADLERVQTGSPAHLQPPVSVISHVGSSTAVSREGREVHVDLKARRKKLVGPVGGTRWLDQSCSQVAGGGCGLQEGLPAVLRCQEHVVEAQAQGYAQKSQAKSPLLFRGFGFCDCHERTVRELCCAAQCHMEAIKGALLLLLRCRCCVASEQHSSCCCCVGVGSSRVMQPQHPASQAPLDSPDLLFRLVSDMWETW